MGNIKIEKLNPHPKNDYYFTDIEGEKYEEVKNSISTYGIRDPIVMTEAKTVISGHQRLRIAKDLGYAEVPVETKDVDEWEAEYLLIAYNTERRGEAEKDPIKKARQAQFLKEYWGIKKHGDGTIRQNGERSMKDVQDSIGESERSTQRLIKLNDLIPELQSLVSLGKLGTTAAEQLAYLTVDEQKILFQERGETIGQMTVDEVKKLRKEIEDLRKENEKLKNENTTLKDTLESMKNVEPKVVEKIKEVVPAEVIKEMDQLKLKLQKEQQEKQRANNEMTKYKESVVKLKAEIDEYKQTNPFEQLSPQAKLYINRHLEIAEDCHKLIEKITIMTIMPPSDLPQYVSENYKQLFYETGKLLMESYEKLSNQNQYIDIN